MSKMSVDDRINFHFKLPAFFLIRPLLIYNKDGNEYQILKYYDYLNAIANKSQFDYPDMRGGISISDLQILLLGDIQSNYEITFSIEVLDLSLFETNSTIKAMGTIGTDLQIAFGRNIEEIDILNEMNDSKPGDIKTFDGKGQIVYAKISKLDFSITDIGSVKISVNAIGLSNNYINSIPKEACELNKSEENGMTFGNLVVDNDKNFRIHKSMAYDGNENNTSGERINQENAIYLSKILSFIEEKVSIFSKSNEKLNAIKGNTKFN
jgi:hypothetical protein